MWTSLVSQWLKILRQWKGHRFNPWSRKIPRATGQLRPCTTTAETQALEPMPHSKRRPPQ